MAISPKFPPKELGTAWSGVKEPILPGPFTRAPLATIWPPYWKVIQTMELAAVIVGWSTAPWKVAMGVKSKPPSLLMRMRTLVVVRSM
jgi:hypothetical protein